MNGSSYVQIRLRSLAILNIQNDDKYCFIWSILGYLHPIIDSKIGHATRVSNYRQSFNELSNDGFDFSKGFNFSDVHIFNKLINLSVNIYELNFHQDKKIGNVN